MSTNSSHRLVEVDTLRGLAALAVVFFHFTTRFGELFEGHPPPTLAFTTGYFGVNLFFIISGFVIFMTLEKTKKPMDFVVSRFSRLFPAYWFAIFLTLVITHLLGLPGKLVGIGTALANMLMIHGFFNIPHVDGVYWTLEVELLFYCGMFLLYRMKRLDDIHLVLLGLLLLRITYYLLEHQFGISLPWILFRILILQYIPWFALGISVYLLVNRQKAGVWIPAARTAVFSVLTLLICESFAVSLLAIVFATTVFLAASGHLSLLRFSPLVWLGTISYPLYLLHENIGWAVILWLLSAHVPMDLAIMVTLGVVLLLASVVNRMIEQPAMRWIRAHYKNKTGFHSG